jgi:hypothetical protein
MNSFNIGDFTNYNFLNVESKIKSNNKIYICFESNSSKYEVLNGINVISSSETNLNYNNQNTKEKNSFIIFLSD